MYLEIGFLVAIILAIALYQNVKPEPTTEYEAFTDIPQENQDFIHSQGKVDLNNERQKLLDLLTRVDVGAHEYEQSEERSGLRVGLERTIAEIDRALETDGRYLTTATIEAILKSSKQRLV